MGYTLAMIPRHHLIVVPGLSGDNFLFSKVVNSWKRYGFIPHVHDVGWKDGEESFKPKLQRLVKQIDELYRDSNTISFIGTSAGGSAVLNALCERKNKIYKVVNICGRLRTGKNVSPTLGAAAKNSKAFYESVIMCEEKTKTLGEMDRKKILTVRALFDEIVPTSTTTLTGAKNIQIISIGHVLSIASAMTIYPRSIIDFLKPGNP